MDKYRFSEIRKTFMRGTITKFSIVVIYGIEVRAVGLWKIIHGSSKMLVMIYFLEKEI